MKFTMKMIGCFAGIAFAVATTGCAETASTPPLTPGAGTPTGSMAAASTSASNKQEALASNTTRLGGNRTSDTQSGFDSSQPEQESHRVGSAGPGGPDPSPYERGFAEARGGGGGGRNGARR